MIIDKIENISKYSALIPNEVINFLKTLSPNYKVGHYELNDSAYVNVDQYLPKPYDNCMFEAHKKYIDIQMVLSGEENLEYTMAGGLEVKNKYDELKDVMFFANPKNITDCVKMTPYKFVLIFPHEAHKPQIKTKSGLVKKAVVKLKINN